MRLIIDVCKKFNKLLSKHQKFRISELVVIMLIGGILETLSVTVILPFMQVVLDPGKVMNKPLAQFVCKLFGIESDRTFLVFLSVLIALMYVLKNLFLLGEYNIQYRFVYNNRFVLQQQLLHTILARPYQYFINASTGEILRLIGTDAEAAFDILVNLLNLFTELVVACMLVVTILIMSPFITLCIAGVLMCLVLIIYRFIRPRQTTVGKVAQRAEAGKNKWLLQAIEGIKEIKVTQKEPYFERKYEKYGLEANDARRKSQILTTSPRFFIEAVSMATMFIVVAVLLYFGEDFEVIVPTLTVVAMAAIRILPSANRITFTLSNIAFEKTRLDVFVDHLYNLGEVSEYAAEIDNGSSQNVPHLNSEIEFRNIEFSYTPESGKVLGGACMKVFRGESVGIVGSSGAGKTTAVDIAMGLLIPQSGGILIDGIDIRNDINGWLAQVGYIPQMIFMLDGSIKENVMFGEEESDAAGEKVWNALREASLEEFIMSLPDGINTAIGERGIRLSGGQRQRIGIARALYKNPEVLIFDEATSALDNDTENAIMESIHNLHGQKTMIIIAHRLTTIEQCDHIYRVEGGKFIKER